MTGVNVSVTPNGASRPDRGRRQRSRRTVENDEYVGMVGRVLRALKRRVAEEGIDNLPALVALHEQTGRLVEDAVHALRSEPHCASWAEIGEALGITRQAAQQRFGGQGARRPGGQPGELR